ncbi:Tar ligand binding domain-containing protein [Candidatus Nitrotoga sp. HW29]|uniref:Tar ligand binding domain-containing protein n=1 Tax=Candidatus Nitrotoga sp. HW29 TaxID=2886963 RepID=UPI001EF1C93C|nr:Tar ligand binding domain-containing protein [Candidatus Nitrotoga sp. HW29]
MIRNLTIQSRLIFYFCLMGAILLGIGSIILCEMNSAKDSLKNIYDDRLLALDQITDIESLILENRLVIASSLVTPTPDVIRLNTVKIEKNIAEIKKIWKAYMTSYLTSKEEVLAAKFVDDHNKLVTQGLKPVIVALRANDIKRANQIVVEDIQRFYQPVGKGIKTLGKLQLIVAKQEYDEVRNHYETIRSILIATAIIGLGFVLWVGFLLVRVIIRIAGDAREITDRKNYEREILATRNQLQATLDAIPDLLFEVGLDGRYYSYHSPRVELLAAPQEELLGKTIFEVLPADAAAIGMSALLEANEKGRSQGKQFELILPQGRLWFELSISRMPTEPGQEPRFICLSRDITSRKQAKHELTRLGRVLDESSNEIYVFDAQTLHFTMVNAEAQRNLGYTMDELKGLTVLDLEPNLTHNLFEQRISLLRLGKQDVVIYEAEHQRKDKSIYPIEVRLHLPAKEYPPVFVAIIQNITERKNIECMKSEFISTVSHELRTPLTSIRGALGLVTSGMAGELPLQAKMLVDIAHKNSERLILLVNDILDMEKIEAGKMDIHCEPVELMPLLHQALEANCAYGGQFNVSYELENDVPGIMVNVDANRLMQVLANLLSNAAKFSFAGDKVIIAVIVNNNRVRVTVKDHGSGIAEPFRSQIFQKFAQSDSSDTRKKGGTGLGLSITRAIVEKMGGMIGFSSEPNVLTTFFVEFPIQAEIADFSSGKAGEKSKRILICEDDRLIAALLHFMLEQDGFVADVAYDTGQAKLMLSQSYYAAMTLDLSLPGQDGIAFIRELRMEEKTAKLPIVVVSARAVAGSLELDGEAYSIIDWIPKPIDKEQMVLAIRRAVGRFSGIRPRVLHVEDDPDMFKVMHGLIGDMADLDHAGILAEAKHLLKQCRYDLVILDLTLPDGSGQELLPLLNGATPPIPVMVFSAREVEREKIQNVASLMVKSRTSDAQLLVTIKRLIGIE